MPRNNRRVRAWGAASLIGVIGSGVVLDVFPHSYQAGLGRYAAEVGVFISLSVMVALFPMRGRRLWWAIVGALVVFAGFLIPRISGFYFVDQERAHPESFYTHLYLLTYPAIVLTVTAAYRLGGGSSGTCLKIAWSGTIILFSGFIDVMWQLVNPVAIPAQLSPPHVVAITGGPVTFSGLVWFTMAHVPLLVVVLLLPLDRWLDRWLGPDPAVRVAPVAPGEDVARRAEVVP